MSDFPPVVGSTVWNLAGGVSQRPDYLKSLIIGATKLQPPSLGQVINQGYQSGPMMKLRSFLQWAHKTPAFLAEFGITSGTLYNDSKLNFETILAGMLDQVEAGQTVLIISAESGPPDTKYWVARYLAEEFDGNIPPYDYAAGPYVPSEGLRIDVEGEGTPRYIYLTDYDTSLKYLYVKYCPVDQNKPVGLPAQDSPVILSAGTNFPILNGWTQDSRVTNPKTATLHVYETVDTTYSDSRPPLHTGPTLVSEVEDTATEVITTYHQDGTPAALPDNPKSLAFLRTTETQELLYTVVTQTTITTTTQTLPGGVVETRTVTRTQERLSPIRSYQRSTQTIVQWACLTPRYYIYAQNSGKPDLDALLTSGVVSNTDKYYPPIPFRYENSAIVTKSSAWHIVVGIKCDWDDPNFELWIAKDINSTHGAIRAKYIVDGDPNYSWGYYVKAHNVSDNLKSVLDKDQTGSRYEPVYQWRTRLEPDDGDDDLLEHYWKSPWLTFAVPPQSTLPVSFGENQHDLSYLHSICKKAFKKAVGAQYDKIQDDILANESIKDIDHAFAVFGVALNVRDNRNRRYIYKYLKYLMDTTAVPFEEEEWRGNLILAKEDKLQDQTYKQHEPVHIGIPYKTLELQADHPGTINYKTELKWAFMKEETGVGILERPAEILKPARWTIKIPYQWPWWTGLDPIRIAPSLDRTDEFVEILTPRNTNDQPPESPYFVYEVESFTDWLALTTIMEQDEIPVFRLEDSSGWEPLLEKPTPVPGFENWTPDTKKAKVGELWWNWNVPADDAFDLGDRVELYWQVSLNSWKKLVVTKLEYKNYVYRDSVITKRAYDALSVPGKESEFILPLHDDILRSLSMADQTQIAMACVFLVFNCYEIKKKEWYQEDWFNYVVIGITIVIAVVITIISYGTAGPSAVSGALAIGAALGLSGWAAVVVGGIILAVLSAIAGKMLSMILDKFLKDSGTAGAVISAIISTIISIALNYNSAQAWTSLSTAQTIMSLTSVLSAGAQAAIQDSIKQINEDMKAMMKSYELKSSELTKLMEELIGSKKYDMELARQFVNELTEKPDVFLKRTLMTGSDIVESTLKMISNYTEYNLKLDLP